MDSEFTIPQMGKGRVSPERLEKYNQECELFVSQLTAYGHQMGMKVSARGWCYILEGYHAINKSQFDVVERVINECRKEGFLSVDFVAEEDARQFSGIEEPDTDTSPFEHLNNYLNSVMYCELYYTPDWWENEQYYLQMLVEKVDLKALFEPICRKYHIPIANAKGWSSILQRAEFARRFKDAEENGLQPVLLYCGDHDPDGVRISEKIRKNLDDIKEIHWSDGEEGYDPKNLIIDRFGLNIDFIEKHQLVWVDNLITGSGNNLADPKHRNYNQEYVQNYLKKFGARKVEANAILRVPDAARRLCMDAIEYRLGDDALARFESLEHERNQEFDRIREETGLKDAILNVKKQLSEAGVE